MEDFAISVESYGRQVTGVAASRVHEIIERYGFEGKFTVPLDNDGLTLTLSKLPKRKELPWNMHLALYLSRRFGPARLTAWLQSRHIS